MTTSFFFLEGIGIIDSCPSIGFPIPTTSNLSNPTQRVNEHDSVINQAEATGIYTGDSSGTYVICVDPNGKPYANYWEGYVKAVTGVAHYDAAKGSIVLDGAPTAEFTGNG